MKHILKTLVLVSVLGASAQVIDEGNLGKQFGGWKAGKGKSLTAKGRHVQYKIDDAEYRTYIPTQTDGPDGTTFVSTRIETKSRVGSGAVAFLETTYDAGGMLLAASVKLHTDDRRIDSGTFVTDLGDSEESASVLTPTNRLILDLFSALDAKIEKLHQNSDEEIERRDLFGRTGRLTWELEDLSAAIRHNLNKQLACVNGYMAVGVK